MRQLLPAITAAMICFGAYSAQSAEYSALASMDTQVAKKAMEAYLITMSGEVTAGYNINGSKLTIKRAGDYVVTGAAQVGGVNGVTGDIYLWVRVNGKDVPDSNSIQTIPSAGFTAVLVATTEMTFKDGDVLEFVYASTKPGLGLIASHPKGVPGVPSIIFSIFEL